MIVEYDNIRVEINNPSVQKKVKGYLTKMTGQSKPKVKWTPEDVSSLRVMHYAGKSKHEMAESLGRSTGSVGVQLWKMGLTKKEKKEIKEFAI